ncbi:MAG: helix-turn-helix transcriptional regulator [Oscillospiraceae bacterium]|nr:helix-turn-helix transcriptional regulator [Oscillospiraceae bacterium]MDE6955025.1 helix-turn-helix domain-containing protein [Oscillospiraceae bacterium]
MDYSYDLLVGQQIRAVREKRGLTQEQLAARLQTCGCDVTRSALAKMEAGQRHIYAVELRSLQKILDVPYEVLLP